MDHKQNIKVTVDAVIFTIKQGMLHVLLVKRKYDPFKGKWAIPGGYVKEEEDLWEAAARELEEETNVKDVYMKKVGAYGNPNRDPRGRIVTIVFMGLIDWEKFTIEASTDASNVDWFVVDDLTSLAFDHMKILQDALKELRMEIQTTNYASQILPSRFTLSELQQTYESILGFNLDKRNFRKRIAALELLRETSQMKRDGAHRPARLFRFKDTTYKTLKDKLQVFTA